MTTAHIEGISGSASNLSWVNSGAWCYMDLPAARLALNGQRPLLIRSVGLYLTGNGSRTATNYIANASGTGRVSSGAYSVPSGGSAAWRGLKGLSGSGKLFSHSPSGSYCRVGATSNGSMFYGRNGNSQRDIFLDSGHNQWPDNSLAGQFVYSEVPTFPRTPTATQLSPVTAKVQWVAPSNNGGEAVTGYRIQYSLDPTFASGVSSLDVGNVLTANITGLAAGSVYYFRVLAKNLVTSAAGTFSQASTTASVTLIAETGDLDAWEPFGDLPEGVEAVTAEGLRRAILHDVEGSPLALLRENNVLSPPGTLAANTYGAQREVTGLTIGKVYRLTASAAYIGEAIDAGTPNTYQLGIQDLGWGSPLALTEKDTAYQLPLFEFTAEAETHLIAVRLAETATRSTVGEFEQLGIWGLTLAEIPSFSPYRLQSVVYESSLVNHFDLACNSVGARWWVDSNGITQFSAELGETELMATFSDVRAPGNLEYLDIATSFDTRNIVNDLGVNQHGIELTEEGWAANDISYNFKNLTSIATWGPRFADLEMSLYDAEAYEGSVEARAAEILDNNQTPTLTFTRIRWNAQEDPLLASKLDIYSRVDVEFRGILQPSRIINIKHEMTGTRWIMTIELAKRE